MRVRNFDITPVSDPYRGWGHDALETDILKFVGLLKFSVGNSGGRGHDGLVNCVRTGMSKSVSRPISKTFVAANVIYSHTICGSRRVSKHVRSYVRIFAGYF